MGTNNVLEMDTLNFVPNFAPLFHEFQVVTSKSMIFQQLPEKFYTCNYRNTTVHDSTLRIQTLGLSSEALVILQLPVL